MTWSKGQAEIEQLLRDGDLQALSRSSASGAGLLELARQRLESARRLAEDDPDSCYVLAYDAARYACSVLLQHQGLRPTQKGGHVAVERAVRAQFQAFEGFGLMRRQRHLLEYPGASYTSIDTTAAAATLDEVGRMIDGAAELIDHLPFFEPSQNGPTRPTGRPRPRRL